jgi:putative molybdopterin biosynthesis protein
MDDHPSARRGQRTGYLRTVTLSEALSRFLSRIEVSVPRPSEDLASGDALGRILAEPVFAQVSSPHYHGAAMDGIAVSSSVTEGATEAHPLRLAEGEGYEIVDTGDPLPDRFDCVIRIEDVHEVCQGSVEILSAASPRQHVRLVGEDIVRGELVFVRGHRLRPIDLGALAATGNLSVRVARRPLFGILPTGDEIVEPGAPLAPGVIIDSSSRMLAGMVLEAGGLPRCYPPCPDDEAQLEAVAGEMLEVCDGVLLIAGSSAGRGDFTARILSRLGELLVHGVNVMPGKPCALAVSRGKPMVGVPGFPVSAAMVGDLFVRPAVARLLGAAPSERPRVRARVLRNIPSRLGYEELVRVALGRMGESLVAVPLARGAGALTSLTRAHGLLRVPESREGFDAGTDVSVELLVPESEVDETLLAVGSHDPSLDVLSDLLAAERPSARLSSVAVGSFGGLLAVAAGEAHLAGSHLLDPATGEYNLPDIERHIPQASVAVITLAHRAQGLLVPKGNPKGLRALSDLARNDVTLVNRQRGSGTRALLDHLLSRAGIASSSLRGYRREEFTHAAVASAVSSGAADTGLAVLAAARALDLDFIPLAEERYDLVIPERLLTDPRVERLLRLVRSRVFREALGALGGYDDRETGRRVR